MKMISNKYAKAYTEVLEILKYFPKEEYEKIPTSIIGFYKENMDKNYSFTIDPNIDLSEQNVSKEANVVFIKLYQEYFATEEENKKIKEILELNSKKAEIEKRGKYNTDDLFKNKKETAAINNEVALTEYKESFFEKFKKFIFKIFKIHK